MLTFEGTVECSSQPRSFNDFMNTQKASILPDNTQSRIDFGAIEKE